MKHANIALAVLALLTMGQSPPPQLGTITGRVVAVRDGKTLSDPTELGKVRVYLEPAKPERNPGAGLKAQIAQQSLGFRPYVLVVPAGTSVSFPNLDSTVHSVFSPANGTKWDGFDLGEWNRGDGGKAKTFRSPGEYDIYCDKHMQMWAKVKVVPSRYYAEIDVATGRFALANVPPGTYRVWAWAPDSKDVVSEQVTIAGSEAKNVLELHLQTKARTPVHLRADGSAYPPGGKDYK